MINRIMEEIERRFMKQGDYIELTMKRTGQKLYIYRQRYGIAVYFDEGNIWKENRKPKYYFPNAHNALKGLALLDSMRTEIIRGL